ncbi:MAG TPA: ribulose-phosphate 3-epimerase [Thermomicrobiales bacterium]|jgi:ribulose-phosphate 3-epimerase|nr:ribulose-phosphate 3-epimerase [Thermomicrobiales bacterium]
MPAHPVRIGPSVLAADFLRLGEHVREAEDAGADYIHIDVMDGRFVPNISIGLPVLEAIRRATSLPLDVHLMIVEPERWVEPFVKAGADVLTVHVEACTHVDRTLHAIEEAGAEPGITLNPGTPLVAIEEVLTIVRQVLVMSVNPGYGGQSLIPAALDKIARLRTTLDERNPGCRIQIDGGVNERNIGNVVAAGADTIVAGTAIYRPDQSVDDAIAALRQAAGR